MADTLSYRSSGRIGADRLVVVVRSGAAAMDDPDPALTRARDIRLLFVRMPELGVDDPEAFGGETPDEEHSAALVRLLEQEGASADAPAGLVGVGEVGWRAIAAAAALGAAVDRLALVAVTVPESPLDRDDARELLSEVTAAALVIDADTETGAWFASTMPDARVETPPERRALTLGSVWDSVLAHVVVGPGRAEE